MKFLPRNWLYYFALLAPMAFALLVLDTRQFLEWLWYQEHTALYEKLNHLSVQPQLVKYLGGWPFPIFALSVFFYWLSEGGSGVPEQFLLLPLIYAPFFIVGDALVHRDLDFTSLYVVPLIVIPAGYLYVLPCALFVRLLDKMRLVM